MTATLAPGALAPAPGPARPSRLVRAQAAAELRMVLRNGEQLLLNLLIPLGVLLLLVLVDVTPVPDGQERVDFAAPGVLALAVMSSAFTGQAISVGFERQYGVLSRLGTTPLSRRALLAAKTLAVLGVQVVQVLLLAGTALLLGWRPDAGGVLPALLLVVVGTAAFSGLGLLVGGTLPGLTALAVANLLWFVLLALGGVLYPLDELGGAAAAVEQLPTAALAEGLRSALGGGGLPLPELAVLAAWAAAAPAAAARCFRWT